MSNKLSAEQIDMIAAYYRIYTTAEIAALVGCCTRTVRVYLRQLADDGRIERRVQKMRRSWTEDDVRELIGLIENGHSIVTAARRINRELMTCYKVLAKHGASVSQIRAGLWKVRPLQEIARFFDVSWIVARSWIDDGYLKARRNRSYSTQYRSKSQGRYLISDAQIDRFLHIREAWMTWDPMRIADPDWRDYACDIRSKAGGEWLRTKDVADRLGFAQSTVRQWIHKGILPAFLRVSVYYVWSADLIGFIPPIDWYDTPAETPLVCPDCRKRTVQTPRGLVYHAWRCPARKAA